MLEAILTPWNVGSLSIRLQGATSQKTAVIFLYTLSISVVNYMFICVTNFLTVFHYVFYCPSCQSAVHMLTARYLLVSYPYANSALTCPYKMSIIYRRGKCKIADLQNCIVLKRQRNFR
jgi:hypothetical protein